MRFGVWIPVALLAGLVAGGLGPRVELRRAKAELARMQEQLAKRQAGLSRVDDVTGFLGIDMAGGKRAAGPAAAAPAGPDGGAPSPPPPQGTGAVAEAGAPRREHGRPGQRPPDMKAEIERAADLWRVRRDVARSSFLDSVGAEKEDSVQFDVLVEAMNVRLAHAIESWVDEVKTLDSVGPEYGIRLVRDLSDAMVLTYDEMDRTLKADWRQATEAPLNMTDFIDPVVALPLVDVEGRLQNEPWVRGHPPGGR